VVSSDCACPVRTLGAAAADIVIVNRASKSPYLRLDACLRFVGRSCRRKTES
jgi:hypothetical protein